MNDLNELLQYSFNQRALLAALIIGLVNGYFSGYVVLRKAALFTGALANTMFPGIIVGFILFGVSTLSAFIGSLFVSLLLGLMAIGIAAHTRIDKDAGLAILWTFAFAGGLLLHDQLHLHVQIQDYLFGNILGLSNADLWFILVSAALVLSLLTALYRPILLFIFEPNIAQSQRIPTNALNYTLMALLVLTMVTSIQAVGVILSLSLLVAPGATMYLWVDSPRKLLWGGALLGASASVSAIVLSNLLNWRTGATIVILLGLLFSISCLFSPRYGLLASLSAKRRKRA